MRSGHSHCEINNNYLRIIITDLLFFKKKVRESQLFKVENNNFVQVLFSGEYTRTPLLLTR